MVIGVLAGRRGGDGLLEVAVGALRVAHVDAEVTRVDRRHVLGVAVEVVDHGFARVDVALVLQVLPTGEGGEVRDRLIDPGAPPDEAEVDDDRGDDEQRLTSPAP